MSFYYPSQRDTRHKAFLSYYHKDDQAYKIAFEKKFNHLFMNKSVSDGDINTDVSTECITKLIQSELSKDTLSLIIFVSNKAKCRKHVDCEISAALSMKVGGYSELMGVPLPTFTLTSDGRFQYDNIPARLADNIKSGYAKMYTWDYVCSCDASIKGAIQDAFQAKSLRSDKIDNRRVQMQRNTCE
jgi:hypothetical protein